jgi:choline dehydrogenase-like flavoprotein
MHVGRSPRVHEVVVVGGGAAGSIAAWNLTRKGVRVLLLDAGARVPYALRGAPLPWEWQRALQTGREPASCALGFDEQPYAWTDGHPFNLLRVWGRGGKMNVWSRVSLRYSDADFSAAARDGWEIPWPIAYRDVAPYYDRLDRLLGVCGGDDEQDTLPGSRDHLPAPPPLCGEVLLEKAARTLGLSVVAARRATARTPSKRAYFNPSENLLDPARATGRLTIVNNAVCGRVLVDNEGRANGVQYFDRYGQAERVARAKVVVLAASCIDTTRILLNSASRIYPNGIANSNDHVGRYLTEQVRCHVYGFLPALMGSRTVDGGDGGNRIYLPRFNHRDGRKRDYLRGYGIHFWSCGRSPDISFAQHIDGFGATFKTAVKHQYPALVGLHPCGEVLPRSENRVTVNDTPVDRYGLPIPRIEYAVHDNERLMVREMYDVAEAMLTAARAEIVPIDRQAVDGAGTVVHEHGTCRMGRDPARSVVNQFCQAHEVPNLFVVDGAVFSTATEKNPTHTILALAWRATDYLAEQLRSGRL